MKAFRRILVIFIPIFLVCLAVWFLYRWNYIGHHQYTDSDFHLTNHYSMADFNKNGKDDLQDILTSARNYVKTGPGYEEKFYSGGWPDDGKGFYVDVVNKGLFGAGYDLQELIWQDYELNPEAYNADLMESKEKAFRHSENIKTYLDRHFDKESTNIEDIADWEGGDIVIFESGHMAVVSDIRNENKVPWLIHHFMNLQAGYEQDVLELGAWGKVVGHYRVNQHSAEVTADGKR